MAPPGFFGKVSSQGDFVGRRLAPELVQAWDGWLQGAMHASRQQLGGDWLALYLTSPVWRFALSGGVLAPESWAGIMMPSVDRVGRHYPLMIGAPLPSAAALSALPAAGRLWFDALEDCARDTLAADFVLAQLEPALDAVAPLEGLAPAPFMPGRAGWRMPVKGEAPAPVPADLLLPGHGLWWTEGGPNVEASMLVCRGMPDAQSFAAMLDGRWAVHGWGGVGPG